jgi:hypothetical protein
LSKNNSSTFELKDTDTRVDEVENDEDPSVTELSFLRIIPMELSVSFDGCIVLSKRSESSLTSFDAALRKRGKHLRGISSNKAILQVSVQTKRLEETKGIQM